VRAPPLPRAPAPPRPLRRPPRHPQLRNLLAAPGPDELLYVAGNRVLRWRARAGGGAPAVVLDASGARAGGGGGGAGAAVAPAPAQLCTLAASPDGLVAAGGFAGELLAARPGAAAPLVASLRLSESENGITNALACASTPSGAPLLVASNNDGAVRLLDATTFSRPERFEMPWAVNCAAAQPGGRLICAVGDDPGALPPVAAFVSRRALFLYLSCLYLLPYLLLCLLKFPPCRPPSPPAHPPDARVFDPSAGGRAALTLRGHLDFSFAAAWHPGGLLVATGNQDRTTRLYDLRAPARPLALLRARIGAVRSLRFSPDGRLLAAAEPADYVAVHAAGAAGDWGVAQAVDLFGEVAGVIAGAVGQLGA
jgi:WD40 repeat protein